MKRVVMVRKSRLEDTRDRDFDVEFWQAQDSATRFAAAWELVTYYLTRQGRADESRLQRSVASLQRQQR